ncbi:hypothetical protein ACJOMK_05280, partial [Mycoplasmopsis synoviae]
LKVNQKLTKNTKRLQLKQLLQLKVIQLQLNQLQLQLELEQEQKKQQKIQNHQRLKQLQQLI